MVSRAMVETCRRVWFLVSELEGVFRGGGGTAAHRLRSLDRKYVSGIGRVGSAPRRTPSYPVRIIIQALRVLL